MRLLPCGHCGRPFYDNEKACPYCGHAFLPLPETVDVEPVRKEEPAQEAESHVDEPAAPLPPAAAPSANSRSESIAAITAANSNIAAVECHSECDLNQIETTYPPRRRRLWVWIVLLLLLAALGAAAYLAFTKGYFTFGGKGIK